MNEKVIWDYLIKKTNNPYGTAAIMGNLMAESSLNPLCTNGVKDGQKYAIDADHDRIDFAHDGKAFGLVQWCYWSRKQALLDYAKHKGYSVGGIVTQLEYMVKEMSESYKTVWKAVTEAKDIRTASDIVMLKYEKPAGTGEAAKTKRGAYAQKFYAEFANEPAPDPSPVPSGKKMVRATAKVNVRAGAGLTQNKIGSLPKGSSLEWIATENGWHKVACWVSGDFSEVIE